MIFYWSIFITVFLACLMPTNFQNKRINPHQDLLLSIIFLVLFFSIGLRYEVGGDWARYQAISDEFVENPLHYITRLEVGYGFLNWIGANWFGGIFFTNFLVAGIFVYGLQRFCCSLPYPAIALLTALPYLVIVVSQGYTRQAAAIGVLLYALSHLTQKNFFRYVFLTCISMTFHQTAIVLLPFSLFLASQKMKIKIGIFITVAAFLVLIFYDLLLSNSINTMGIIIKRYVFEFKLDSSGAFPRLLLVATCSATYLVICRRLKIPDVERRFWAAFSFAGLVLFGLFLLSPSSTVIDRVGLYWLPLQVYLLSHLPTIFSARDGNSRSVVIVAIIILAVAMQWVWLFYADSASCWLPYQFYPWELIWGTTPYIPYESSC